MTPTEFEPAMNKMISIFHPKNWDDNASDAYFGIVRRWTYQEWEDVVDEAIRTSDFMPKPKRLLLLRVDLLGKDEESGESGPVPDCDCCFGGLIQFQVQRGSLEYDRVCACTCDAGKRQLMNLYGGVRLKSYIEVFNEQPPVIKECLPQGVTVSDVSETLRTDMTDAFTQSKDDIVKEAALLEDQHQDNPLSDDGLPF